MIKILNIPLENIPPIHWLNFMEKETVLVTGGAGYIGSHTVKLLNDKKYNIIVLDNLVYGHEKSLPKNVQLIKGDVGDKELLSNIFSSNKIEAVFHFAAYAYVGESVISPSKYYQNNVVASLKLLDAMVEFGCKKIIFSSTCATYGLPQYIPIDENHPQQPINPYGQSKLMLEKIIIDYQVAYDLNYVFLRYFNASGADESGMIGEDHNPESHLIPLAIEVAQGKRDTLMVFGTDYDTEDGTCVRDYIHVTDLSEAHLAAFNFLKTNNGSLACNIGTGSGFSVKEIIDSVEKVAGLKISVTPKERRKGDPCKLISNSSLAKEKLGWVAKNTDINNIIKSAWNWHNGSSGGKYECQ